MKGFSRIHAKKFTRSSPKTWEDKFLGKGNSGLKTQKLRQTDPKVWPNIDWKVTQDPI